MLPTRFIATTLKHATNAGRHEANAPRFFHSTTRISSSGMNEGNDKTGATKCNSYNNQINYYSLV